MPKYTRKMDIPGKTAQELFQVIADDIQRFMEKTPVPSYDIERDTDDLEVRVTSTMVDATLSCVDGEIHMKVRLSLVAGPFRVKLDQGIDRWLSKRFDLE